MNLPKEAKNLLNRLGKLVKEVEQATQHLKESRSEIEKKVQALLEKEGKKLNARVNEFLTKLLSTKQKPTKKKKRSTKPRKKPASKKKASPAPKTDSASLS